MPARYRVIIMPRAAQDAAEICSFIEQDSPQNAASVAQELLDAIYSLDVMPRRYEVHLSRRDASRSVHSRSIPCRSRRSSSITAWTTGGSS